MEELLLGLSSSIVKWIIKNNIYIRYLSEINKAMLKTAFTLNFIIDLFLYFDSKTVY